MRVRQRIATVVAGAIVPVAARASSASAAPDSAQLPVSPAELGASPAKSYRGPWRAMSLLLSGPYADVSRLNQVTGLVVFGDWT